MRLITPFMAGVAALALMAAPAAAETPVVTLTPSWQKVLTGGGPIAVDVQVTAGQVFLTTVDWNFAAGQSEPGPPAPTVVGQQMLPLEHRCITLTGADLYARAGTSGPTSGGTITVMDGVSCGGRGY